MSTCKRCLGPTGSGSNHEEDSCTEIYIARLEAEIERLKGLLADALCAEDNTGKENDLLRAALKRITREYFGSEHCRDVAREALGAAHETPARHQRGCPRDRSHYNPATDFCNCGDPSL